MKLALNGATTMKADLETDIRAAAAAGFELLEIWAAKLRVFLRSNSVEDLKSLLEKYGVAPYSINSIEHITFRTAEDYDQIKTECRELSRVAGAIRCPYIVVVPGKLPMGADEETITAESVKILNELADIAGEYGVALAFEFLGQTDCSVQTLDHCQEIIARINRKDVGLVIDTFHFFTGNSTFGAIRRLDPEKLFIFHINDAEDRPKETLTDAHRLYPGEGILPLREIKENLDRIGYGRMASIEIFRPEYWEQDPFSVAAKARQAAISALGLEGSATHGTA